VARPRVEIDLSAPGAARYAADLARDGLFIPGEELALQTECEIVIHGGDQPVVVAARVVFADGNGIGVQLEVDAARRTWLVALATAAPAEDAVDDDDGGGDGGGDGGATDAPGGEASGGTAPRNVYERMRGLTLVQQFKVARAGELNERVALERLYGKAVWEQLLRNPRITPHEVARIARMGNLPRPQLETICGNATWLNVPEIRRALLANPRLAVDMIGRILRHLPRHELKLVPNQLAYPATVREAARRMLKPAP
jgi:hypothetical protein